MGQNSLLIGLSSILAGTELQKDQSLKDFAKFINGKVVSERVVTDNLSFRLIKHHKCYSVEIGFKTDKKLGFSLELDPALKLSGHNWQINPPEGTSKELDPTEKKRIHDWFISMYDNGYFISDVDERDGSIIFEVSKERLNGPEMLYFVHQVEKLLGIETMERTETVQQEATRTRRLTPAEIDVRTRNWKEWKAKLHRFVAAIVVLIIIAVLFLIAFFYISPNTVLIEVSLPLFIIAFLCASGASTMDRATAKNLNMNEGDVIYITKVKVTEAGVQNIAGMKNNYAVIDWFRVVFPDEAPFNIKKGDIIEVEKFKSGKIYKVNGVLPFYIRE